MKTRKCGVPGNWRQLEAHPLAKLTDFGVGIDLDRMIESIKTHGYDETESVIIFEGKILDHRHVHAACVLADVTPSFREFVGTNAAAYVCKKIHRQHLTKTQQALLESTAEKAKQTAKKLNREKDEKSDPGSLLSEKQPTLEERAKSLGVSRRTVIRADKVAHHGTEKLNGAVMEGAISVKDAAAVADLPMPEQDEAVEAVKSGAFPTAKAAVKEREAGVEECEETADEKMKRINSEIESFCRRLGSMIDEIPKDAWLDDMGRSTGARQKIRDACGSLRSGKCVSICPVCKGKDIPCRPCHSTGRMPKQNYDQAV